MRFDASVAACRKNICSVPRPLARSLADDVAFYPPVFRLPNKRDVIVDSNSRRFVRLYAFAQRVVPIIVNLSTLNLSTPSPRGEYQFIGPRIGRRKYTVMFQETISGRCSTTSIHFNGRSPLVAYLRGRLPLHQGRHFFSTRNSTLERIINHPVMAVPFPPPPPVGFFPDSASVYACVYARVYARRSIEFIPDRKYIRQISSTLRTVDLSARRQSAVSYITVCSFRCFVCAGESVRPSWRTSSGNEI